MAIDESAAEGAGASGATGPEAPVGPPELSCYPLWPNSPPIAPATSEREWMDLTGDRFAYRCVPMSVANASGWEIALPFAFEAAWYGADEAGAVQFRSGDARVRHFVTSHFGHGVVTFHTGWLFRTSPGWAVWARGAPNTVKDGIAPLDGLVETDWLPFPFTMNWRFTRPGVVRFAAGEPFCFLTLAPHGLIDAVQPRIVELDDDPKLKAAFEAWSAGRGDFARRLAEREDGAANEGRQRTYVQGRGGIENGAPAYHLSKRRLKAPS